MAMPCTTRGTVNCRKGCDRSWANNPDVQGQMIQPRHNQMDVLVRELVFRRGSPTGASFKQTIRVQLGCWDAVPPQDPYSLGRHPVDCSVSRSNCWSIRHSEINQITFALPILVFLPRFRDRSFGILPSLPHFATARRFASGIYCRWTMKVLSDGTLTLITFAPGLYASFKIAQWTFQPEQS